MHLSVKLVAIVSGDNSVGSGGAADIALESARMLSRRGFT